MEERRLYVLPIFIVLPLLAGGGPANTTQQM